MQIHKNIVSEYPVGILWNMGSKFAREMLLKIAIMEDVIQVKVLDLGDAYEQFVLDCYEGDEEAYEGGYIYEKIKNMDSNNKKVVAFILKIDNPTYKIAENGNKQCIEARKIKKKIRNEYAPKIKGYFFDNLIHMSDNTEEMERVLKVLKKYNGYTVKDYVRKGYQPIMKKQEEKEETTYTSFLKGLREDNDER